MWGSEDEHKPIIAALTYYQKIDVLEFIRALLCSEGKDTSRIDHALQSFYLSEGYTLQAAA